MAKIAKRKKLLRQLQARVAELEKPKPAKAAPKATGKQ